MQRMTDRKRACEQWEKSAVSQALFRFCRPNRNRSFMCTSGETMHHYAKTHQGKSTVLWLGKNAPSNHLRIRPKQRKKPGITGLFRETPFYQ
ncbi:MAG: hypothetical protein LBJ12_05040 [Oscillospiraceae bacterium]|nr:hypothetical protein [Oscillospiraceae bacterium]